MCSQFRKCYTEFKLIAAVMLLGWAPNEASRKARKYIALARQEG